MALLGGTAATAQADEPQPASTAAPYTMELTALIGAKGVDLTIEVVAAGGLEPVQTLKKVQLKTYAADGTVADVMNLKDVAAPEGIATLRLGKLARGRKITADVLVKPAQTYVIRAETLVRLRPDLAVASVDAPLQTLTTRPVDLQADIVEQNGDTGAAATVTLVWGPTVLGTQSILVPAGGRIRVAFAGLTLATPAPVELTVLVTDAAPAELDTENNSGAAIVDVTAHVLARARLLVPSLGGYGAELNQHVYAAITSAPPGSLSDLEAKVKALEPQLVRIFYAEQADTTYPDRMASFVETVQLAHEAGATINITYQSTSRAKLNPTLYMGRFAAILEDLVHTRGLTNVRWVTVQNEPNDTAVTLAQYETLYRALHAELVARGLDDELGLMGGDLVEFGDDKNQPNKDHRIWFDYMADHMNDIIDAYSVHIYWNYWDIPRMEFRLRDVRQIVTEELPPEARKPTYVTEFGVRGILNFPGKPAYQPGYWADGTQMARTNIAAFQQLWFNLASAQLGFTGTVKWDAYWGKYDGSYNGSHWLIGPAEEGWPLMPAYHAFRMLLQTTQRGWQVLGVDPWADDDWKDGVADQREQEVVAYAGPNGELTLIGLDSSGRGLNAASAETSSYSIGGLQAYTMLNLAVWNAAGNGENAIVGTVATNAAGVVRFEVPLHAAFALTTVPVS
jgi:hypothetical protein